MRRIRWVRLTAAASAWMMATAMACAEKEHEAAERGQAAGELIRAPIFTEMRTILRDVRMAQTRAQAEGGSYVSRSELGRYLDRSVPGGYRLELSGVSTAGYRAEVVHERSGLRCHIQESARGSLGPVCD